MKKTLTIYHGSTQIIPKPIFHGGKKHNDFGYGFYCTEDIELAKEWAAGSGINAFVNKYSIDIEYLKVLNLNSSDFTILNWIAILLKHRVFSISFPVAFKAYQYIIDNFYINVDAFDVIIGFRADDSYFDYANAFITNSITLNQLARAMKLGNLGEQVVIKSEYAFSQLRHLGVEEVSYVNYGVKRRARENQANKMFLKLLEEEDNGLYINDILKEGIKNDDPRIPRNVFR